MFYLFWTFIYFSTIFFPRNVFKKNAQRPTGPSPAEPGRRPARRLLPRDDARCRPVSVASTGAPPRLAPSPSRRTPPSIYIPPCLLLSPRRPHPNPAAARAGSPRRRRLAPSPPLADPAAGAAPRRPTAAALAAPRRSTGAPPEPCPDEVDLASFCRFCFF